MDRLHGEATHWFQELGSKHDSLLQNITDAFTGHSQDLEHKGGGLLDTLLGVAGKVLGAVTGLGFIPVGVDLLRGLAHGGDR